MALQRSFLAVFVLLALAPAALAQGTPASLAKLKVAVADFEVRGGNADLGKNLADAFAAPLFQTKRFELYDRRQTVALLNEVRFTQLGLAEQAQQLQSRNIDVLVTGTLNINSNDSLRVDVLFTNVRTAQVQFADSIEGRGPQDFPGIAARLVDALAKEFPLQGVVLGQDTRNANRYYISVGSGSNVAVGLTGKFFQFQAIGGGRQIPLEAGSFRVVELSLDPTVSVIEVQNLANGYKPKEGDAVTISLTGPAAPPNSPGSVLVQANAPGTTILVDGQSRGQIAAAGGSLEVANLSPGQHTVVARANGYADATQAVTVTAGGTARLNLVLNASQQSGNWPPSKLMAAGQVWTVSVDGQAPVGMKINGKDNDGDWAGTVVGRSNSAFTFMEGASFVFQVGDGSASTFCIIPGPGSVRGNVLSGDAYYRKSNGDQVVNLDKHCTVSLGAAPAGLAWPVLPSFKQGQQWVVTFQGFSPWTATLSTVDADGTWGGSADIGSGLTAHTAFTYDKDEDAIAVAFADSTGIVVCSFVGPGSLKGSILTGKAYSWDEATETAKDLNLSCTASPKG